MANTFPDVVVNRAPQKAGDSTEPIAAALTADPLTTAVVRCKGWPIKRIINSSGATRTITFYDRRTNTGNDLTTYDQDLVAVAAMAIPNNSSVELPSSLAGVTNLVPVLSTGTATVYFVFER